MLRSVSALLGTVIGHSSRKLTTLEINLLTETLNNTLRSSTRHFEMFSTRKATFAARVVLLTLLLLPAPLLPPHRFAEAVQSVRI